MLDLNEMLESSAERRYEEMDQGDGTLKCSCGAIFDPRKEGGTLSPNPYAIPVCNSCISK